MTVELIGHGFKLRSWRVGDEAAVVRHGNNIRIWRNMSDAFPHPYTHEAAERWIRKATHPAVAGTHLAVEIEGEAAGGMGMEFLDGGYRKTAEVGYWLAEAYWGRGISTATLRAFTRYAFETFDLERLHARVFEWNPASCRVLEKAGFHFEGTWRRACLKEKCLSDVHIYSFIRPDLPCLDTEA